MTSLIRLITAALVASVCSTIAAAQEGRAAGPPFNPRDISGFWELPFDGRQVSPARLTSVMTRAVLAAQAKKDANAIRWCNFLGMPAVMGEARPLDIRQGRREIVVQPEVNATPRHLYFRSAHVNQEEFDPTTSGDSIARWDGDTLVVDTIGFAEDKGITAIPGGGFRTGATHLVERYRLLKNGSILSITFTWEDPRVFRVPHTYEFRYQRLGRDYEPRQRLGCDPFDEERAAFLTKPPQPSAGTAPRRR
jgi:hypothetical protein